MTDPIQALGAVTVHVTDIQRARTFWTTVMGLQEIAYQPQLQRAAFVLPGTNTILSMHEILDPREGGRAPGTVSGIVFGHKDPAAALAEIERRGGTVVTPAEKTPWGLIRGVFADPDGNEFLISSAVPPPSTGASSDGPGPSR